MKDLDGKLIISYSALAAFKNCPKSYEIEYEWMRESKHANEAVKKGSLFHRYMELIVKNPEVMPAILPEDEGGKMWHIAVDYIYARGLPSDIMATEESLYWEVMPDVVFRVTPDLLYRKDNTIICRDWKTFGKRPSLDIHISDQARFYIITLEALYNMPVEFEFVYVRSERIGIPRPRSPAWNQQDSYFTVPYSLSALQKQRTKIDLVESIRSLLEARRLNQWYRTGRTGYGMASCTGCFQRPLCSEEWEHGFVSPERLEALSTQRESLLKVDEDA